MKVFLFLWFYVGWFGCVYSSKLEGSELSLIFPLVSFFCIIWFKIADRKHLLLLFTISAFGLLFDFIFFQFGFISFPGRQSLWPPIWLFSMWLLFASVLPLMHSFFAKRLHLAALGGAVFGPLSYYYGTSMQILFFSSSLSVFVYGIFWGLSFPAMIYFQRKIL